MSLNVVGSIYQVRFYFRIWFLLIPIWYRRKETILGIAFFLSDFYKHTIAPSDAIKMIYTKEKGGTLFLYGNKKLWGKRMRIVEVK